jgi:ribosomal protein L30/L7E
MIKKDQKHCCMRPRSVKACWGVYSSEAESRIHYVYIEHSTCHCPRTWYLRIGVSRLPLARVRSLKGAQAKADAVMKLIGLFRTEKEWYHPAMKRLAHLVACK